MAFLSALAADLIKWALGLLVAFIAAAVARAKRRKKIDDAARASVVPLKNATTGEAIDAATDDALDHI